MDMNVKLDREGRIVMSDSGYILQQFRQKCSNMRSYSSRTRSSQTSLNDWILGRLQRYLAKYYTYCPKRFLVVEPKRGQTALIYGQYFKASVKRGV